MVTRTSTPTSAAADLLARVALARLGLVGTPAPSDPTGPGGVTPAVCAATLAELARVGVRVTNPEAVTDALAGEVPRLVALVRAMRGERGRYTPLFRGFPDQLPGVDDGRARLLAGTFRLLVRALELEPAERVESVGQAGRRRWRRRRDPHQEFRRRWARLTDDDVREAMDFSAFGGWPASSVPQDVERAELDRAVQSLLPPDGHVEWLTVTVVPAGELADRVRSWMADAFAAPTSLRDDVRADLGALTAVLGVSFVDPATVRFRETATLLHVLLWSHDPRALRCAGLTPDDVLRLMAQLTGTDTSLRGPLRFPPLTRAQRRLVVDVLEASPRLGDVFRRRGPWLAIARGLHLAEYDAPRVREVFSRLRSGRRDATSLMSRFEAALGGGDLAGAVALLEAESPGVLLRRLRRLAARAGSQAERDALVDAVRRVAAGVPLRVLFTVRAQVLDNGRSYPRVAFTPRGAALEIPGPQGHLAVDEDFAGRLVGALDEAIAAAAAARGDLTGTRVWIDPLLHGVLVPDGLRATAQGLVQVERGSRLPLRGGRSVPGADDAARPPGVLRVFVHWRQDERVSDLDLSMMALDERFEPVSQVSWTQLTDGAMTHSGDLTSAPAGAEEFIDVRLDVARGRPGWRYLVPSVFRYAGPSFGRLPEAYAGWMLRRDATSDRATFDVSTVVNAFALTGSAGTAVPFAVDLLTEQVVYVDVYRNSPWRARVEREGTDIARLLSAVSRRAAIKASVQDVAWTVLVARGAEVVAARPPAGPGGEGTLTVGLDDGCALNALRPEKLLAELL